MAMDHRRGPTSSLLGWGMLIAGLAASAAFAFLGSVHGFSTGSDLLLALSFALFLYGASVIQMPLPKGTTIVARFGAGASFSLYAIHYPIVICLAAALTPNQRWQPSASSIALATAILVALIVIAWSFSRFTEAKTPLLRSKVRHALIRR
jgi:peptidoglycan/LPS O-acetylase OafA/YrhL